jgi:hypothetical protein
VCPVLFRTSVINNIHIVEKNGPKLRKINSPDTTASSRTEGRRVFEIKLIYMRNFSLTVNEYWGV